MGLHSFNLKKKQKQNPTSFKKSRENPDKIREKGAIMYLQNRRTKKIESKLIDNQRRLVLGFEGKKGIERGKESKEDLGQKNQQELEQLGI